MRPASFTYVLTSLIAFSSHPASADEVGTHMAQRIQMFRKNCTNKEQVIRATYPCADPDETYSCELEAYRLKALLHHLEQQAHGTEQTPCQPENQPVKKLKQQVNDLINPLTFSGTIGDSTLSATQISSLYHTFSAFTESYVKHHALPTLSKETNLCAAHLKFRMAEQALSFPGVDRAVAAEQARSKKNVLLSMEALLAGKPMEIEQTESNHFNRPIKMTPELEPLRKITHAKKGQEPTTIEGGETKAILYFSANNDRMDAERRQDIFYDHAINELPPGSYNFTVSKTGVVFGRVRDNWEIGTKHISLAQAEPVVAAGEMSKNEKGELIFNIQSGTFMAKIKSQEIQTQIIEKLTHGFSQMGATQVQYQKEAFQRPNPTREQMKRYCQGSDFSWRNETLCHELFPELAGN